MRAIDTTTPPENGTAAPVVPVPAPRATIGTPCARQACTIATTSSVSPGKATAAGNAQRRESSSP